MSTIIEQIKQVLVEGDVLTGDDVYQRSSNWHGGNTLAQAVIRPCTTQEVSDIVRVCAEHNQPIVTEGGKTGLVGGTISTREDIVISTERMRKVEELDLSARTLTVQAGVILETIQETARENGLQFPMDLGARGSASIGGNIATNAGGNRVLRYGMTRSLVLGLEVVLADGSIISSMNKVIKNNAGYDLKQWFIGSEGTLGIITRAVLRLSPLFESEQTALLATERYEDVIGLLHHCDQGFGGMLSSFEVMWHDYYREASEGHNPPLPNDANYYVLIETQGTDQEQDAARFEKVLTDALEFDLAQNAIISQSQSERASIWAIRDNIEALNRWGHVYYFDISLPIDLVGDYLDGAFERLKARWPNLKAAVFGHLGDGNIHIIASIQSDKPEDRLQFDDILYQSLPQYGGSISAEHGVGLEKKPFMPYSRSEQELALMRQIKKSLDPRGLLNPGKIFD